MNNREFKIGMIAGGIGALVLAVAFADFGGENKTDTGPSFTKSMGDTAKTFNSDRDGDRFSSDLDMPTFTSIKIQSAVELDVQVGERQSVNIQADRDMMQKMDFYVEDEELVIGWKKKQTNNTGIKLSDGDSARVRITVQDLHGFVVNGAVDADIRNVDAGAFGFDMRGAGDVSIQGSCTGLTADIRGAGSVDMSDLKCEEVDIELRGVGDVSVFAQDRIDAQLKGVGNISVYGKPEHVHKKVGGFGSITIK